MTIEHRVARTADPSQRDVYRNCFYACRFCNRSRGVTPLADASGAELLDPCEAAWATHFRAENDCLVPQQGMDAAYTHATYRLDDIRKKERRAHRRETMNLALAKIDEAKEVERAGVVALRRVDPEMRVMLQSTLRVLRDTTRSTTQSLLGRYAAEPRDRPVPCRCESERPCQLPSFLEKQLLDMAVVVR